MDMIPSDITEEDINIAIFIEKQKDINKQELLSEFLYIEDYIYEVNNESLDKISIIEIQM